MYCSHCGNEVNDEAEICVKCGCRVRPTKQTNNDDASSLAYALLGFFIPIVGLILFLVWNDEYPLRAKSAGKGALINVIVMFAFLAFYIIIMIIWGIAVFHSAISCFLSLLL